MQGNFGEPLYGPVYAGIGVPATLTTGAGAASLTVIDDTRPKTLATVGAAMEVRSVGPGAFARIPELTAQGIARADYVDAVIAFNGRTWTVRSYELMGNPNGEDQGEVRLLLKANDDA